ncbi:hypothetical protein Tco_0378116 [Tanacetum coccineum]
MGAHLKGLLLGVTNLLAVGNGGKQPDTTLATRVSQGLRQVNLGREAPVHELSDWAFAKVYDRNRLKSAKWDYSKTLPTLITCNYTKSVTLKKCISLWAKPWFTKTTLKDTYQELVYPLKDPKLWETPNDLQVVLPPIMNKRPAGRPKNKDRIRSTNEAPTLASCTRCGMNGHNRNGCSQPFPTKYATTKRRQEHLSQEARLDEERLRNGRIYMDWINYEATEPMVSHPDNYTRTQVVEEPSDQGNIQQSQQESSMNYHSFHLDDL